ncbi:MAG: TetR/AcrR family transcriptional regulator [Proteobacteria bacterium]|nr:TetR/AcrR family transcriptional regulator [Pseudomonadota bacterium]
MARPRSEDKRLALLDAATEAVAAHGLGAPTSRIAMQAGVAEGTLFRYFPTKDALLNELYLHIKQNMCEAMTAHFVPTQELRLRAQALWNSYIDWGIANASANSALNQLEVSEVLMSETRARGHALFPDTGIASGYASNTVFAKLPEAFSDAIFVALADVTMRFAARDPKKAKAYKASGFAAMWTMFTDPKPGS